MSMYSLLKNNPRPSKDEIEKSFDGNICRCTGYRAILESMKTFAADEAPIHDIEDLMQMKCLHQSSTNGGAGLCDHEVRDSCDILRGTNGWHAPNTLAGLVAAVKRANESETRRFKLVSGNTAAGVYKSAESLDQFDTLISVRNVQELSRVEKTSDKLTIGSAVSLAELARVFESASRENAASFQHLGKSAEHLRRVASGHVRNVASWSGNLALKRQHPEFPSDVLAILESIGAKLNLYDFSTSSGGGVKIEAAMIDGIDLVEYVSSVDRFKCHLIVSMEVPRLDQSRTKVEFFKTAHRSQNSHSYVNAGFRFEIESDLRVSGRPCMIFNGLTSAFNRATRTEEFLAGKSLSDEAVLKQAIRVNSI